MIDDRLAFLDENLEVIPWAAESWKRIDDQTWDVTLRDGMEFHDGKPVTVEDLKFTLDFLMKYRSEEHTSELQSLMRISYAVFCLKKKKQKSNKITTTVSII